jgi:hypothetical protein
MHSKLIQMLMNSHEPSIRHKAFVNLLGNDPDSAEALEYQRQVKKSDRVKMLLSERNSSGEIPYHPYKKWSGAHWVLSVLADLGYPPGDESLSPLKYQVYDWLFSEKHQDSIKSINGRVRRCASQEGNALYYLLKLGIADENTEKFAEKLLEWQWPDSGWNCDKNPAARKSSFYESLIPMRALLLHARLKNNKESNSAAMKASEIFLKRGLFRTIHDGSVIKDEFIRLRYPRYYYYDILFALVVLAENDLLNDKRCGEALNLLESKRLANGGFPAELRLYGKTDMGSKSRGSLVDWGYTGKRKYNEWITADALYVLKKSPGLG